MKIILFANTDWYLYNFRLPLALTAREQGYEVILISPSGEYGEKFRELGYKWIPFSLSRKSINPYKELLTIFRLRELYKKESPDIVHHFTIKCVVYGSIAAKVTGIRNIINAVTGLGAIFVSKSNYLQKIVGFLYKIVLRGSIVIFQNPDDRQEFEELGFVKPGKSVLIRSSGVDIKNFYVIPETETKIPIVVLPARMLWSKGIGEFVEAAKIIHQHGKQIARFVLVGNIDTGNPAAIKKETINKWEENGIIEYWGWQKDMVTVYQQSHIVCLPSYREGVPKTLLEAAACGKPLVATDVPGCREIVVDGKNGLLVPPYNSKELAQAITVLLGSPKLRQQYGHCGRNIVENEFTVNKINMETIAIYERFSS